MEFKNIQQLKKEIEEVENTQDIQHTLKFDDWKIWFDRKLKLGETKASLQTLQQVCEEIKELDIELFLEDVVDKKTGKKVEVPKEIRDLWDIYWEHIQDKLLKKFQGEEK